MNTATQCKKHVLQTVCDSCAELRHLHYYNIMCMWRKGLIDEVSHFRRQDILLIALNFEGAFSA